MPTSDFERAIGRLEGKLDSILDRMKAHDERANAFEKSIGDRVNTLEHDKTKAVSYLTMLTIGVGTLWQIGMKWFTGSTH